jgi:lipid-A-disaccharide synthase-like uncharacterized protein
MTECLAQLLWFQGRFVGVDWHPWKVVGWIGNIVFFSRFLVQWWATEKNKQVVVPNSFWWLSLIGSLCLLAYGVARRDSVFIFAYLFTWIPYMRNLVISHRVEKERPVCRRCDVNCPPDAKFCHTCGQEVVSAAGVEGEKN